MRQMILPIKTLWLGDEGTATIVLLHPFLGQAFAAWRGMITRVMSRLVRMHCLGTGDLRPLPHVPQPHLDLWVAKGLARARSLPILLRSLPLTREGPGRWEVVL
jgi:hypothetical protein